MTCYSALFTAAQVSAIDAAAIAAGTPAFQLMSKAGAAAFDFLRQRWPACRAVVVLAGPGNNGGDGYVVAHLARQERLRVTVLECGDPARLDGAALAARLQALADGVPLHTFSKDLFDHLTQGERDLVLVDALLGTGSRGAPRGHVAEAISSANAAGFPILALDIPSGLQPDTGCGTNAVNAAATICFIGLKQGLFTGRGPDCCGEIILHDLGVDPALLPQSSAQLIDMQSIVRLFPPRRVDAHKGNFGRVVVVGGETGFGGAVLMAAEAAARSGAGTVAVLTRTMHVAPLLARRPEIMVHGVDQVMADQERIAALLRSASVIVAGPGLGKTPWARQLLQQVLAVNRIPLVLDADALNLLSEAQGNHASRSHWILTPHPGEAARLLGSDTASIQADRFAAVRALQQRLGGVCLLKGAGSLVCYDTGSGQQVDVCTEGNPGMASGGMGDVLSGIIAGFVAQGIGLTDSLRAGVCVHGEAADLAASQRGQRGLLATDLLDQIGRLINPVIE